MTKEEIKKELEEINKIILGMQRNIQRVLRGNPKVKWKTQSRKK